MSIKSDVLAYLKAGNTLSGLDGYRLFSTLSVRNRISELRAEGYNIQDRIEKNEKTGKHYSVYWLDGEPDRTEQEESIAHNNLNIETAINHKQLELAII